MIIDKSLELKCGVYMIEINNSFYIGSSTNLYKRIKNHISLLYNHIHHNKTLQNLYNEYGLFTFKILEFCDPIYKLEREEYYISLQNTVNDVKHPTTSTKEILGTSIIKVNAYKEILLSYDRITDLGLELKVDSNTISESIRKRGVYQNSKFFYIKNINDNRLDKYIDRIIVQLSLEGNILNFFYSLNDANNYLSEGRDILRYYIDKQIIFQKFFYLKTFKNIKIKLYENRRRNEYSCK